MKSCQDVIERIQQNDRSGYEDVVSWYAEDVLRLCRALLWNDEEAKDVFQESMLRLVKSAKSGRIRLRNGSIKGYLMTTARNLCIDRLRIKTDLQPFDQVENYCLSTHLKMPLPDEAVDEHRFQEAFENALDQLTVAQRTVLVLHEFNGEKHEDIAKTLHISIDSVKGHLVRARKKMQTLMEPYLR